jgi:hypothetical protein
MNCFQILTQFYQISLILNIGHYQDIYVWSSVMVCGILQEDIKIISIALLTITTFE